MRALANNKRSTCRFYIRIKSLVQSMLLTLFNGKAIQI